MSEALDGLVTFFASHHAIRADKVLSTAGFDVQLIPGPKELSPNCGVALRIRLTDKEAVMNRLDAKKVQVDEVLPYRPRTDDWDTVKPGARRARRLARKRSK